ncbi:threonine aldolase family protein [Bacillus suaedaesalsae]|uniref:threonine aldolase family protein n=1 Tax=Bacillus suaedaesalsae TaxID=2810349 RepID=UPI003211AF15
MSKKTLIEAFKNTSYQLVGHGNRNVQVLKEVFEKIDGYVESDIYGTGKVIENFQAKIASFLGKEEAVFFPSGTMAQQIALRIWCDERDVQAVAYHPLSHLEIHEEDGLRKLHGITPILLAEKDRVIELEDVKKLEDDIACLLLELPQREIGGQLPSFETLEDISKYCKDNGIKLHLDGARLYEILPYYEKSAEEICALFDSVYISFYKGIGGIAGAILAGPKDFIQESKVWKRRHGGDLISLYPYILSADYNFDLRLHKMKQYYENAKELAELYNSVEMITTKPLVPVSNMFHVHIDLPKRELEPLLVELFEKTGIGLTSHLKDVTDEACYYEVSIGDNYPLVPKDQLQKALNELHEKIQTTKGE